MHHRKAPPNTAPPQADHETRLTPEDHLALRTWIRLLTCTSLIEIDIRQKLRGRFDITLPRFGVMAQLERSPEGLPMGELSERMMVTGGNITAIVDQLDREGLVLRQASREDRRRQLVRLTPKGRDEFMVMAREHEQWIIGLFGGIDDSRIQRLYSLLGELKQSARQNIAPRREST